MFCPNCSHETKENDRFCPNCGHTLSVSAPSQTSESRTSSPPAQAHAFSTIKVRGRRNIIIAILVLILIVSVIAVAVVSTRGGGGNSVKPIIVLPKGETITFNAQQGNGYCCQLAPPRYSGNYSLPKGGVVNVSVTASTVGMGEFYLYVMSPADFKCYEQESFPTSPCSWIYEGTITLGGNSPGTSTSTISGSVPTGTWMVVMTGVASALVGRSNVPEPISVTLDSNLQIFPGLSSPPGTPIGIWNLCEGSGSTAANSIHSGTNLTLHNSPAWVGGGNCGLTFSGSNYASGNDLGFPIGNSPRSLAVKFSLANFSGNQYIFFYGNTQSSTNAFYLVFIGASSSDELCVGHWGGGDAPCTTYQLTLNHAYCAVETFDGSTANLYVNDTLVASAPRSYTTPLTGTFYVAGSSSGGSFNGSIYSIAFYNGVLSTPQISSFCSESTK